MFKPGDVVAYVKNGSVQIGLVKNVMLETAFVYYHSGETAALTKLDDLMPITNAYCFAGILLGGLAGASLLKEGQNNVYK